MSIHRAHALPDSEPTALDRATRKVQRRILPLLFLLYISSYLDRNNIGFAQLQMKNDLQFSDAIYGLGASIFYVGYILFEIPSNFFMNRIGARLTMFRIAILWGLVCVATMFVRTPLEFYIARFLLGVADAGLPPGIMLYLTYWLPPSRRAAAISLVLVGPFFAGVIGGPIAGAIMQGFDGTAGLHGWQWMFLMEGIPSVLLGFFVFKIMVDRPADAKWLTVEEKEALQSNISNHAELKASTSNQRSAFATPTVYMLTFAHFGVLCGAYVLTYWLPTVIYGLGVSDLRQVGFYAAIPNLVGVVAMILYNRHSDKTGERRWHYASALVLASVCLFGATLWSHDLLISLTLFTLATAGFASSVPLLWAISASVLAPRTRVFGLAIISALSSLSGVIGPFAVGVIRSRTGDISIGIHAICILLLAGACTIFFLLRARSSAQA